MTTPASRAPPDRLAEGVRRRFPRRRRKTTIDLRAPSSPPASRSIAWVRPEASEDPPSPTAAGRTPSASISDRAHVRRQRREHVRAAREVDDAHPTLRARREAGGQLPLHLQPARLDVARQHRVRRIEHQNCLRPSFIETPGLCPAGTGGERDRDDTRAEQRQANGRKGVRRQPHVALEQRVFGEFLAVRARPSRREQPEPYGHGSEQKGDRKRGHGQTQTRRERVAATRSSSRTSASAAMRSSRRIPTRSSVRTSLIGVVSSSLIRS